MPKVCKIFNITVEKTDTNKYYASICIETEVLPLPKTGKQIGFDVGLVDLLIGSDELDLNDLSSIISIKINLPKSNVDSRR